MVEHARQVQAIHLHVSVRSPTQEHSASKAKHQQVSFPISLPAPLRLTIHVFRYLFFDALHEWCHLFESQQQSTVLLSMCSRIFRSNLQYEINSFVAHTLSS